MGAGFFLLPLPSHILRPALDATRLSLRSVSPVTSPPGFWLGSPVQGFGRDLHGGREPEKVCPAGLLLFPWQGPHNHSCCEAAPPPSSSSFRDPKIPFPPSYLFRSGVPTAPTVAGLCVSLTCLDSLIAPSLKSLDPKGLDSVLFYTMHKSTLKIVSI